MTAAAKPFRASLREGLGFVLSNRIPRRLATRLFGWFSKLEHPLLARVSIALWRRFADLDLSDAKTQRFASLHACFIRELRAGARPVDPDPAVLASPCDALVGAHGRIAGDVVIQAKGSPYALPELLLDSRLADYYRDGVFVTLRLTPTMYHRFHAPCEGTVERVGYVPGDTWNVNPAALARVPKLFCQNERAVIPVVLRGSGAVVTLVPVAAILVAGIRLHFLPELLGAGYRGEREIRCRAALEKGDEMGWFEHGSTIIVLAPRGFALHERLRAGDMIRMGSPLLRLP